MKRWIIIILAAVVFPFSTASAAGGTCVKAPPEGCRAAGYDYSTTVNLTEYGTATCDPTKGGVTVPGNGQYQVCCQTQDETNSRFSVQAPLCGSSDELGKANSSCWTCGDTVRCSGADANLAFGHTDDTLTNPANRQAVNGGDTTNLWKISNTLLPNGFEFNGQHYDAPPGDVIVCTANVAGCGATDTGCTNIRYPEFSTDEKGKPYYQGKPIRTGSGGKEARILANPRTNAGEAIRGNELLRFTNIFAPVLIPIFVRIRYGVQETFDAFPNFRRIGAVLEQTAFNDLLPSVFVPQYSPADAGDKPGRYPLKGANLYRYCAQPGTQIPQPDGSERDNLALRGVTATQSNIGFSDLLNPRAWPQAIAGSHYLAAILTRARLEGVDFITPNGNPVNFQPVREEDGRTFLDAPWEEIDSVAYQCGAGSSGIDRPNTVTLGEGEARTHVGSGFFGAVGTLLAKIMPDFLSYRPCGENDQENCANFGSSIVETDSWPAGNAVNSASFGVSDRELNDKMSAAERKEIIEDGGGNVDAPTEEGQKGGWPRSFFPAKYVDRIRCENATLPQYQNVTFAGFSNPNFLRKSYMPCAKTIEDTFTCVVDNAVNPATFVRQNNERCPITQGDTEPYPGTADRGIAQWTAASTITPAFSITDTNVKAAIEEAAKGHVPACVLEAVKYIESGTDWSDSKTCSVNACSAAGPLQITTGWAPDPSAPGGWDSHCRMCGGNDPDSRWIDGKRDCPDGWPGNWPVNTSDPSPCEAGPAAKQAVDMLQAKAKYWTREFFGTSQALKPATATEELRAQQDAIIVAGNSYYGSGKPVERLGGCSYGEFVYQHCDASYSCTGEGKYLFPNEQ